MQQVNTLNYPFNLSDFCQTFDDGPTEFSAPLIDYLGTVNQKTTYFQIGSQIVANYLITQRQYAEGHEIAIHTWSHNDLTTLSSEQVYAELAWCIYAVHSAIGQTPKLFRPPYGSINDNVRQVAAQLGLTVITLSLCVVNIAGCHLERRLKRLANSHSPLHVPKRYQHGCRIHPVWGPHHSP